MLPAICPLSTFYTIGIHLYFAYLGRVSILSFCKCYDNINYLGLSSTHTIRKLSYSKHSVHFSSELSRVQLPVHHQLLEVTQTHVHPYMTTGKSIALIRWNFVGKIMSLLFNMLFKLVITFLPRRKSLLISWLCSSSAVILEPPKIKSDTVSIVSPSICH